MVKMAKYLKEANYYENELKNLLPIDQYGVQIALSSSKGKTKFINLNKESFQALQKFVKENDLLK